MLGCMAKITFLGTGLIGGALAEAAAKRGDTVCAFNRTLEKARPLAALGVQVMSSAAEAVRGSERVHIALADDAAVDAVLAACEWGKDDYSLNVQNLPMAKEEPEEKATKKTKPVAAMPLFEGAEE